MILLLYIHIYKLSNNKKMLLKYLIFKLELSNWLEFINQFDPSQVWTGLS